MSAVTVIGLGAMGSALARTLHRSGHDLTVWNRSAEKMKPFVAMGATGTGSINEAVQASPLLLVCVDSYATTRSLMDSEDVIASLSGRTLVQLGTATPGEAQESADWFQLNNVNYIDGAIECLPAAVGTQKAQFLFAGPERIYRDIDPALECLGGDRRYLGENIRAPATLDLAWLSQRLGQMIGALHGICLCESEAVDLRAFESMLPQGDRVQILASRIREEKYLDPDASVEVWDAVSRRMKKQAQSTGISCEFPDFAASIIKRAMNAGFGSEDISALIKVLRQR